MVMTDIHFTEAVWTQYRTVFLYVRLGNLPFWNTWI